MGRSICRQGGVIEKSGFDLVVAMRSTAGTGRQLRAHWLQRLRSRLGVQRCTVHDLQCTKKLLIPQAKH